MRKQRKAFVVAGIIFILATVSFAGDVAKRVIMPPAKSPSLTKYITRHLAKSTHTTSWDTIPIGTVRKVGFTWYDMQHNETGGRMIVRDDEGGIHMVWMCGEDSASTSRHVYYNYLSPTPGDTFLFGSRGKRVDPGSVRRSGYTACDVGFGNIPIIAFHQMNVSGDVHTAAYIDIGPIVSGERGVFMGEEPPFAYFRGRDYEAIWPKISFNSFDSTIHMVSSPSADDSIIPLPYYSQIRPIIYWKGTFSPVDFVFNWSGPRVITDTLVNGDRRSYQYGISVDVDSWRNKVALGYVGVPRDPVSTCVDDATGEPTYNYYVTFFFHNIYVAESNDGGESFTIREITHYTFPPIDSIFISDPDSGAAFRPYYDISVFYDPTGKLHLAWSEAMFAARDTTDTLARWPNDSCAATMWNYWRIMYWNEDLDAPVVVAGPWGGSLRVAEPVMDHPSIGMDNEGNLFVCWEQGIPFIYSIEDTALMYADTVAGATWEYNIGNKEVYVCASRDGGRTWGVPVDITNTHTPAARPGLCASEIQPSLAERVDNYLHIFYIRDKCAGLNLRDEGPATNNDAIYHRVPKNAILASGVDEEKVVGRPSAFRLNPCRPNPFNASTEVSFATTTSKTLTLQIFNIQGQLVKTLFHRKTYAPGEYHVVWDGTDQNGKYVPSGTYLYRLEDDKGDSRTRRMVLLK